MKKKVLILLFILIIIGIVIGAILVKNNNYKKTDAYKFKTEYEKLNGETSKSGKKYRELDIPKNNRMKYSTAKEIVKKIDNNESFVVYFGFAACPWCRSMVNNLIDLSIKNKVDIYYVDVYDIRDILEVVDGKIKTTKEGDKYYMELLDRLDLVLSDYSLTDEEGKKIETKEKRIYAPNVVTVVNGLPEKMVEGISEDLKDPYGKITDKMKKDSVSQLKCIFKCLEKSNVCTKKSSC